MKMHGFIMAAAAVVVTFSRCAKESFGSITTPENRPAIFGVLYNNDGTFARNVTVTIRKKNSAAAVPEAATAKRAAGSSSVATDGCGRFSFDSNIEPDMYVIEAKSGNDAALIDSVRVLQKRASVGLVPDTLRPMGVIKGRVRLAQGGDPQKIFALALGIDRFSRAGADGGFCFNDLARGVYTLRFISSLAEYDGLDYGSIAVSAAETTDVATMELPCRKVPVPQNLTVSYDTLSARVTLRWSRLDSALVKEYILYREPLETKYESIRPDWLNEYLKMMEPISSIPVGDTEFLDTTALQDFTYEYRLAGVNKNGKEGVKSNAARVTISSYFVIDTIYSSTGEIAAAGEDIRVRVDSKDDIFLSRRDQECIAVFDGSMNFKRLVNCGMDLTGDFWADADRIFAIGYDYYADTLSRSHSGIYAAKVFNSSGTVLRVLDSADNTTFNGSANCGIAVLIKGNSVLVYSIDGRLKGQWNLDTNQCISQMGLVADSNKIFIGLFALSTGRNLIAEYDTLGNKLSEINIPQICVISDMAFDKQEQRMYVTSGISFTNNEAEKGVIYVFDMNGSAKAVYRFPYIESNELSIALQSSGLLAAVNVMGNPIRIVKFKPMRR
jgi:hypothetical protein